MKTNRHDINSARIAACVLAALLGVGCIGVSTGPDDDPDDPGPGVWQTPILVDDTHTTHLGRSEQPSVVIDAAGNGTIVWKHVNDSGVQVAIRARVARRAGGLASVETLPETNRWVENLKVVRAGDTGMLAVWRDPGQNQILAQTADAAGWSAPQVVVSVVAQGILVGRPGFAVNSSGRFVIAWQERDPVYPTMSLRARVYDPIAGWSDTVGLASSAVNDGPSDPVVSVGDTGAAIVTWTTRRDGMLELWARRLTDQDAWLPESRITGMQTGWYNMASMWTSVDATGNASAIWLHYGDEGQLTISSSSSTADGAWSTPTRLDAVIDAEQMYTGWYAAPKLAMGTNGHMILAWRRPSDDDTSSRVLARHYDPQSRRWGNVITVADGLAAPFYGCAELEAYGLDVAVDSAGNAVVVWEEKVGPWQLAIHASGYTPARGWEAHRKLTSDDANAMQPVAVVDGHAGGFALWQQTSATEPSDGTLLYLGHLTRDAD